MIHTYFLSNIFKGKNTYKTKFFKRLSFQSEFNKKRRVSIHPYFLWKIIEYLKKKKLYSIYFIIFFVFLCLNILFFENRIRIWVYLFEKQQTLPNSFSDNKIFYIASNVVNIEDIIEVYIEEMKKLIKYLGYKNVIISIVENGDSVDNTRRYLQNFQNYLNENKILNQFSLTKDIQDIRKIRKPFVEGSRLRIDFYAKLRNKCLDYLYKLPNIDFDNTVIIFLNDVIFRYEDIINLLATNNENFDLVCGFDVMDNHFYDRWVSVDLDGNRLDKYFPYFINKEAQDLFLNHKPIRVFSCWNGVISFKASPLKGKKLQFRHKINNTLPKYLLNTPIINYYDYYESECTYINIDLFSLGFSKIFINPDVRVVYRHKDYFKAKYNIPSKKHVFNYFLLYFTGIYRRRNKFMSNYNIKEIKLNNVLKNWYSENKIIYKN